MIQDPVRGITVAEATELPVAWERDCVELMQLVGAAHGRAGCGLCSVSHHTVCKHVHAAWPAHPLPSPNIPCQGIANRAVSATAMNAGSSRSHCVIYVVVEKAHGDGRVEFGKLCLVVGAAGHAGGLCWNWWDAIARVHVSPATFCKLCSPRTNCSHGSSLSSLRNRCLQDLAGSERQDKTGAVGQTATEGNLINKSLRWEAVGKDVSFPVRLGMHAMLLLPLLPDALLTLMLPSPCAVPWATWSTH